MAGRIAAMAPQAVAEIKRTVLAGMEVPLDTALMLGATSGVSVVRNP